MKRVIRLFPQRRPAVTGEQLPECYARSPQGQAIIRLRLSSPAALLMPFESFPINFGSELDTEKTLPVLNLNKDLIEYLFARIAEIGNEALLLRVTLPADSDDAQASPQALHSAIQRYFAYLEKCAPSKLD